MGSAAGHIQDERRAFTQAVLMTVAVGGRFGIFIRTDKADFNKLFQALVG